MKGITKQEFLQKNLLHISNIEEGFEKFDYGILSGKKEAYQEFIECIVCLNGEDYSYFDFYYEVLQENEKEKLLATLSEQEKKEIEDLAEDIYYPLKQKWIGLISKITAEEKLFSTLYFEKYPCTLWGNYGLRYPIFFRDGKTRKIYENAAIACGLEIE